MSQDGRGAADDPASGRRGRRRAIVGLSTALVLGLVVAVAVDRRVDDLAAAPAAPPAPTAPAAPPTPVTRTPSPTPAATTAPTSPAAPTHEPSELAATPVPSPLPGPRPDGIDEIAAQVAALRGIPLDAPIDARVLAPDTLADRFAELSFADLDPVALEADRRLLAALRLINPDVDLLGIVEALYREQILGLYVTEEKVFYVAGEDAALTDLQRSTAAHEVTHALQDRAHDLGDLLDVDEREGDAALAIRALVEGDAVDIQDRWSAAHQSPEEQQLAVDESRQRFSPTFGGAPAYLRDSINFPYLEGRSFVDALLAHGGRAAIDAAFREPPTTTAQILHPERYLAGEGALPTTVAGAPGTGWDEGTTVTFGAFDLDHLLRPLGRRDATATADGWAGGEARAWQRGADDAVGLALTLRSPGDATRACAAMAHWYAEVDTTATTVAGGAVGTEDAFALSCTAMGVAVGVAPDLATARAITDG